MFFIYLFITPEKLLSDVEMLLRCRICEWNRGHNERGGRRDRSSVFFFVLVVACSEYPVDKFVRGAPEAVLRQDADE